ncbi:MAG TPA: hypothetical protein VMW72_22130 [Sedimentisphaerales bacterium]|nr:hypothetical protein [Sedimentisphaerales bacterium]
MTKGDLKEFLQWSKKNWLRVLIFLGVWLILGLGVYQLLFFISYSALDEDEYEINPRFNTSLLVGFGLTALGFYLYFNKKKQLTVLKNSFQVLIYLHGKSLWSKLPLDEFDQEKNLALGLTLKAKGVAERFDLNTYELNKILEKLSEDEWCNGWYRWLKELDELILDNLEDWIKQHFPKKVYFIRLRLLEDYIQATKQRKYLVYDRLEGLPSEKVLIVKSKEELLASGENIPGEFYKLILNKYYSQIKDSFYQAQPVNFDHRLFRKCFTTEGAVWAFLREAYRLLWDAYEYDVHRTKPPTIGELLSNVSQIDENKELPNTDVAVVLRNAYETLSKAHKIYKENVRELPRCENSEIDSEIYAEKELLSDAGEKMLPYLNEAEKYLIDAENFLKISREEMPRFWSSPPPIKQGEKEPVESWSIPSGYNPNEGKCGWHFAQGYKEHIRRSRDAEGRK